MENRKRAHIDLAFEAQLAGHQLDDRFYYEPLFVAHPDELQFEFIIGDKTVHSPFWVSSMTGGTEKAGQINRNLAKACHTYKMGMGLGSCRILLRSPQYFEDFNMRPILGENLPLFANMGIAQLEEALQSPMYDDWMDLLIRLQVDGLIVHINPLQEWMQPEGDRIVRPPIDTLTEGLDRFKLPMIVKEVGQGFGRKSLAQLAQLPLEAIDFGANGGTNFTLLELLRADAQVAEVMEPIARIGHSAEEMVNLLNLERSNNPTKFIVQKLIISGGIKHFLDGYYLHQKSVLPALIGQASTLLKRALHSYEELDSFLHLQHEGWKICQSYLTLKK